MKLILHRGEPVDKKQIPIDKVRGLLLKCKCYVKYNERMVNVNNNEKKVHKQNLYEGSF